MSYILNALRKSEQSRRNNQTPTLDSADAHPQPDSKKSHIGLILLLTTVIILLIVALFWFYIKSNPTSSEATPAAESVLSSQTEPEPQQESQPAAPQGTQQQAVIEPVQPVAKPETYQDTQVEPPQGPPGFAEIIAQKKLKPVKTKQQDKPMTAYQELVSERGEAEDFETALGELTHRPSTQDQPAVKPKTPEPKTEPATPSRAQSSMDRQSLSKQDTESQKPPTTTKPAKPSYDFSVPYLKDMPFNFRRNVPKININVYVFADTPKDRFILVDMERYKAGEEIAEGMKLKQILSNALVVTYEGKTFKIKRP